MTPFELALVEEIADREPADTLARQALEIVLAVAQLAPAPRPHDFGKFGDLRFCQRAGCQRRNDPIARKIFCRGELPAMPSESCHCPPRDLWCSLPACPRRPASSLPERVVVEECPRCGAEYTEPGFVAGHRCWACTA